METAPLGAYRPKVCSWRAGLSPSISLQVASEVPRVLHVTQQKSCTILVDFASDLVVEIPISLAWNSSGGDPELEDPELEF